VPLSVAYRACVAAMLSGMVIFADRSTITPTCPVVLTPTSDKTPPFRV